MAGGSKRVAVAVTLGHAVLAAMKLGVSLACGSAAMFAEAVHSAVRAGSGVLSGRAGAGEYVSDRERIFRDFAIEAGLFACGAGAAFCLGVLRLLDPQPLTGAMWAYLALGVAFAVQVTGLVAERRAGETAAPEYLAGLAGLGAALAGVALADRFGMASADGAASVAIGVILLISAWRLSREYMGLLIGSATPDALVDDIIGIAGQAAFVDGVNEVRVMHLGPGDVLVNLSVDARDHLSAGAVEAGTAVLEAEIIRRYPEVTRVFIEIQKARDGEAAPAV